MNDEDVNAHGEIVNIPRMIIAEDDLDDQLLIKEALLESGLKPDTIVFVQDGQALLNYLRTSESKPSLILLDLNMPKMDGREALREIKKDATFSHIPVVIFTTSKNEDDIQLTYRTGGNSFFTKPALFDDLVETMQVIKRYWFEKAVLPLEWQAR